jgi:hypothetical protein
LELEVRVVVVTEELTIHLVFQEPQTQAVVEVVAALAHPNPMVAQAAQVS